MKSVLRLFVVCTSLLVGLPSIASDRLEFEEVPVGVVEKAISEFLVLSPNHPLNKDATLLREHANSILVASRRSDIPWWAIVTLAACESTFKVNAVGKVGEVGLLQLNGLAPWKRCEQLEGRPLDHDSMSDQYLCGAHWFRESYDQCGDLKGAIASYASGNVCKAKPETSLGQLVNRRAGMMASIKIKIKAQKKG